MLTKNVKYTLCPTNISDFFFVPNISSDVLALPIFKQEESSLPSDNENKILPFQYVLCASTSPAVKLHEETLTYLNQGSHWAPTLCLALVFAFFLWKFFFLLWLSMERKTSLVIKKGREEYKILF